MSYNKNNEVLRRFISESIINEKLATDAGKGFTDAEGSGYTAASQGAQDFSQRWGWGLNKGKAVKAKGILGFFGLPQSAVDFVGSVQEFFAAVWKVATNTGKFFVDILTKTINPSPSSPRVENWTTKTFPNINAWFKKTNKASWGSSYGNVSIPSLGPKPNIDIEFKAASRLKESIIYENTAGIELEFLSAVTSDAERLIAISRLIQGAPDIVNAVSNWQEIVDTESSFSVLITQVQSLKPSDVDMEEVIGIFKENIAKPYIQNSFEKLFEGIENTQYIPDSAKDSARKILNQALQSI